MENELNTKYEERDEEAEETLSFCDLPLHSLDSEQSFLSLQSYYSAEDNLFEFSNSDLSDYPSENILVFGKLISPENEKKSQLKSSSVSWPKKSYKNTSFLQRQVSTMPANSRWPLLMVGPAKVPEKRNRRSSSSCSERKIKREKKLWGMIKALGCGGGYLAVA